MTRFTRSQRLRYWFDNVMSAGTVEDRVIVLAED
jgi:hypothetical protein